MTYAQGDVKMDIHMLLQWTLVPNAVEPTLKLASCEISVLDWCANWETGWKYGLPPKVVSVMQVGHRSLLPLHYPFSPLLNLPPLGGLMVYLSLSS